MVYFIFLLYKSTDRKIERKVQELKSIVRLKMFVVKKTEPE